MLLLHLAHLAGLLLLLGLEIQHQLSLLGREGGGGLCLEGVEPAPHLGRHCRRRRLRLQPMQLLSEHRSKGGA